MVFVNPGSLSRHLRFVAEQLKNVSSRAADPHGAARSPTPGRSLHLLTSGGSYRLEREGRPPVLLCKSLTRSSASWRWRC